MTAGVRNLCCVVSEKAVVELPAFGAVNDPPTPRIYAHCQEPQHKIHKRFTDNEKEKNVIFI